MSPQIPRPSFPAPHQRQHGGSSKPCTLGCRKLWAFGVGGSELNGSRILGKTGRNWENVCRPKVPHPLRNFGATRCRSSGGMEPA